MYCESQLQLPDIQYIHGAQKCIGCTKYLHKENRIRIDINTWSNQGYCLSANKITYIFAHHKILIHHRNDLICFNCDQQDIKNLKIECVDVKHSERFLSSYNRSLIYISQRLIKKNIIFNDNNNDNETKPFDENVDTNRKNNSIKYELLTNNDCSLYCKLNKYQIKELSQLYDIPEQNLFYFFARYTVVLCFLKWGKSIYVYTCLYVQMQKKIVL